MEQREHRSEAQRRANNVLRNLEKQFETISIPPTLSIDAVKRAFRMKALEVHPDKGGSAADFRQAKEATDKIRSELALLIRLFPELQAS